ncbi:MAG: S1/P1 nuclease [Spongiibacteraceae bacterium]
MRYVIAALLILSGNDSYAWGDKGHQVIAHIAWHYLTPATREKIDTLLRDDDSGLTATDFISQSEWADEYRDSDRNTTKARYEQTRRWHYINLKLAHPDFAKACYGSPPLKPNELASRGPANACITDKVEQFAAELASSKTSIAERRLALQFLIHLVGDLHQPLHVGDNNDAGGNDIDVSAKGFKRGTLHRYWDTAVIGKLGRKPETIARRLIEQMGQNWQRWQRGNPRDWTMETFSVSRDSVYAQLPPMDSAGIYRLDERYVESSKNAAAQQLSKAGVRLAGMLESLLATRPAAPRNR